MRQRSADARLSTAGVIGGVGVAAVALVGLFAPWLAPHGPFSLVADPLQPPSRKFMLGSDGLGRDLLSQLIYGTRTSLTLALVVAVLAMIC